MGTPIAQRMQPAGAVHHHQRTLPRARPAYTTFGELLGRPKIGDHVGTPN